MCHAPSTCLLASIDFSCLHMPVLLNSFDYDYDYEHEHEHEPNTLTYLQKA